MFVMSAISVLTRARTRGRRLTALSTAYQGLCVTRSCVQACHCLFANIPVHTMYAVIGLPTYTRVYRKLNVPVTKDAASLFDLVFYSLVTDGGLWAGDEAGEGQRTKADDLRHS